MRKKLIPQAWEEMPDIFWLTPEGGVMSVIGHLTAMQGNPEAFGLPFSPQTNGDIDAAFRDLFERGWVRGRYSDGVLSIQMERPRGVPMGNAHAFAVQHKDFIERVDVDYYDPKFARMSKEMSAKCFIEQKFPLAWGLNPRRRTR